MNWIGWHMLVFCLLFSGPLFALKARCGSYTIHLGDTKERILDNCGEPDSSDSHYEKRQNISNVDVTQYFFNGQQYPSYSIRNGQSDYTETEVLVDVWIYSFKRGRIRKSLYFENGQLHSITSLKKHRL
jgi:Protein of unknown function (DUF2845)